MTPEEEEGLRRDGLCRTCGRACWPLDLTADNLCVACCEKERDALLRASEEARTLNLELVRVLEHAETIIRERLSIEEQYKCHWFRDARIVLMMQAKVTP